MTHSVSSSTQFSPLTKQFENSNANLESKTNNRPQEVTSSPSNTQTPEIQNPPPQIKPLSSYNDIEIAFASRNDDAIHSLLGTKQRLPVEDPAKKEKDLGLNYNSRLFEAKRNNLLEEQIVYLIKLGQLWIELKDFKNGAKSLNSAMALLLAHKKHPLFERYLFQKMESCEQAFYTSIGLKVASSRKSIFQEARIKLKKIREECAAALKNREEIQKIQGQLTLEFKNLFKFILEDSLNLIPRLPCKFCCVGLGSMAREEMSPNSDVEAAFIIEKKSEAASFRLLAEIVEMQMINLGETKFPLFVAFDPLHSSANPCGFSMDTGGNTPLGSPGFYELIGTPEQIASFNSSQWIRDNQILANALSTTCLVMGDEKLYKKYEKERSKVLKLPYIPASKKEQVEGTTNREVLTLKLMRGALYEFKPNLSAEKEELKAFGIKKELYRPLQEGLSALSLLFKLKEKRSSDRLEALKKLKILSQQGANNIKKAFSLVLALRVEAHLFYKDEQEFLFHQDNEKSKDSNYLYFTKDHLEALYEIYQVLLPFQNAMEKFYASKDKKALASETFLQPGAAARAKASQKSMQYTEARKAYQEAVALNPHDRDALMFLSNLEGDLGNFEESAKHAKLATAIDQKNYPKPHPAQAVSLSHLGIALQRAGKFEEAHEEFIKGLNIEIGLYGEEHEELIQSYENVAQSFVTLTKYDEALMYQKKALQIEEKRVGKVRPLGYNNLGLILMHKGLYKEAEEVLVQALQAQKQSLTPLSPHLATIHNNLSNAYTESNQLEKAIEQLLLSLNISMQIYGRNHESVSLVYCNLGNTFLKFNKYDEALDYFKKALDINENYFQKIGVRVAGDYNNVGYAYLCQQNYPEALKHLLKAQELYISAKATHKIDTCYNNLAFAHYFSKKFTEALDCAKQAIVQKMSIYKSYHPEIEICVQTLIACTMNKEVPEMACKVLDEVFPECERILGKDNQFIMTLRMIHTENRKLIPKESKADPLAQWIQRCAQAKKDSPYLNELVQDLKRLIISTPNSSQIIYNGFPNLIYNLGFDHPTSLACIDTASDLLFKAKMEELKNSITSLTPGMQLLHIEILAASQLTIDFLTECVNLRTLLSIGGKESEKVASNIKEALHLKAKNLLQLNVFLSKMRDSTFETQEIISSIPQWVKILEEEPASYFYYAVDKLFMYAINKLGIGHEALLPLGQEILTRMEITSRKAMEQGAATLNQNLTPLIAQCTPNDLSSMFNQLTGAICQGDLATVWPIAQVLYALFKNRLEGEHTVVKKLDALIRERAKDSFSKESTVFTKAQDFHVLGTRFLKRNVLDKARGCLHKAINYYASEKQETFLAAQCHMELGSVYSLLAAQNSILYYNTALELYETAQSMLKKLPQSKQQQENLIICLNQQAAIHQKLQ